MASRTKMARKLDLVCEVQVMRALVGFAVLLHYPINQHVARSALYDLIFHYKGTNPPEEVPYSHVQYLTLGFFALSVGTACVVRDLGIVFQVIGGLAGSLLVFVLPGGLVVAHCRGRYKEDTRAVDTVTVRMHEVRYAPGRSASLSRTSSSENRGLTRVRRSVDEYMDVESVARAHFEDGDSHRLRSRGMNGSHAVNGNIPEEPATGVIVRIVHEPHPEIGNTAMECEPLGWALIVLGACVFAITMYITFVHKHE
jgi:hypothetical protein